MKLFPLNLVNLFLLYPFSLNPHYCPSVYGAKIMVCYVNSKHKSLKFK